MRDVQVAGTQTNKLDSREAFLLGHLLNNQVCTNAIIYSNLDKFYI